jgi:hypothetical protein
MCTGGHDAFSDLVYAIPFTDLFAAGDSERLLSHGGMAGLGYQ